MFHIFIWPSGRIILLTIVDATCCSMMDGGDVIGSERILIAVNSCGRTKCNSVEEPQVFLCELLSGR